MLLAIILVLCLQYCTAAVSITGCGSNGKLEVNEIIVTQPVVLTCLGILANNHNVWDILLQNGTRLLFTSCTYNAGAGNCSYQNSNFDTLYFAASRVYEGTSVLTVTGNFRNIITGTVRCLEGNGGNEVSSATCDVRVVYSADQHRNKVIISSYTDWTLKGQFTVDKVFASDGLYSCRWTLTGSTNRNIDGNVSLSAPFTENGLQYSSATCSFSTKVSAVEGSYTAYTTLFSPGAGLSSANAFTVVHPVNPPELINCPASVVRGSNINCTCTAAAADPSAVVTWPNDDISASPSQTVLNLTNIQAGGNYTCRQYWGGWDANTNSRTTNYNVTVTDPTTPPPSPTTTRTASTTTANSATGNTQSTTDVNVAKGGVSLPTIIGAAVGGGVLLIIIVVVVVVIRKRCGSRPAPKARNEQVTLSRIQDDDEDFEEHHNSLYQSSDGVEPRPPPPAATSKPTAVATRISANSSNYTTPDTGVYNDENVSDLGYTYVATTAAQPSARVGTVQASGDEYAVVNKPKPNDKKREGRDGETTPAATDEYAVVNKPKPNPKPAVVVTGPKPKPKVALKPKPSAGAANSGNTDDGQPAVANGYEDVDLYNETRPENKDAGGEYNALSFSQKALVTPSDDADSPVYSHLKHDQ